MIKTVEWTDEGVRMIDQRLLPNEEKYLTLRSCEEVAEAIKAMVVRGAPAIGVSAAMGIALGTMDHIVHILLGVVFLAGGFLTRADVGD